MLGIWRTEVKDWKYTFTKAANMQKQTVRGAAVVAVVVWEQDWC